MITVKNNTIEYVNSPDNEIDTDKQKIYNFLKVHEPIISLIKDGMIHYDHYIMDSDYSI